MINILFSGDYEIWFGQNYLDLENVLVKPTYNLLETCSNHQIPLTLFVDTIYLLEKSAPEFKEVVINQLKTLIKKGHDIQLHIHPHWLFSIMRNGEWHCSPDNFVIGEICRLNPSFENDLTAIFKESILFLEEIGQHVNNSYRCHSYRAGNYGLQPNPQIILKLLSDNNIKIDSSIIPGYSLFNEVNQIDFTNVPGSANYYLNPDLSLTRPSQNGIFEVPIPSYKETVFDVAKRTLFKLYKSVNPSKYNSSPSGRSIQSKTNHNEVSKNGFKLKIREGLQRKILPLELFDNPNQMLTIIVNYLKNYNCKAEDIYLSINCHPKSVTDSKLQALVCLKNKLQKRYKNNIEFINFSELNSRLQEGHVK